MSVQTADRDPAHLYPPFRRRLEQVLKETSDRTGFKWVMTEGYRSPERQLHLWHQGRTRPGPIVTWLRFPKLHGAGLAADCYPSKNGKTPDFSIGRPAYLEYRRIYQAHGLGNGAWTRGDMGHVELDDRELRQRAWAWVRAGFPESDAPPAPPTNRIQVFVDSHEVPDAGAFLKDGRAWMLLRPVADALDVTIAEAGNGKATLVDEEREYLVRMELQDGRGVVPARELEPLVEAVRWEPARRRVELVTRR